MVVTLTTAQYILEITKKYVDEDKMDDMLKELADVKGNRSYSDTVALVSQLHSKRDRVNEKQSFNEPALEAIGDLTKDQTRLLKDLCDSKKRNAAGSSCDQRLKTAKELEKMGLAEDVGNIGGSCFYRISDKGLALFQ